MLLSKYISGTIFIDDKYDEVEDLIRYFERYNIWSKHISPDNFDGTVDYNYAGARLVFLDLQYTLSGGSEIGRAVNILRDLSQKGIKNYILVVWSMHSDEIEKLVNLIDSKMNSDRPLLVLDANKEECIRLSYIEFNNKIDQLFKESIENNQIIYSLLEWEKSTVLASRDTFNDIISLSYNSINNNFELEKVLLAMSKASANDVNIKSAFPYIHDILNENIIKFVEQIDNQELASAELPEEELNLKLNALQMIKRDGLVNSRPGDVYTLDLNKEEKDTLISNWKENFDFLSTLSSEQIKPIQVDITPPCTFIKEDKSIMINGIIIIGYSNDIKRKLKGKRENFSINYYYDTDNQTSNILILDFIKINYVIREDIKDEKIFCLKTEFRSSIQQQFGSFLTRIGNNIINP